MSLLLDYIRTHPKQTKRLIGMTLEEFNTLVEQAEVRLNEQETQKIRVNSRDAGCTEKLSNSDQILLAIDRLKRLDSFQSLGIKFEVSESTAHNIFQKWLPILKEVSPASLLKKIKDYPG